MKRVHPHSDDCGKSEMMLFSVPPTQNEINKCKYTETFPVASLSDNAPIEFHVPGNGEQYIDLARLQLHLRCKITKADGSDIDAGAKVAPVNLMLHSLFSQVNVLLNEKLISGSSNTYPFKAYIETLLTHGNGIKTSELTAGLFYKDTAGQMNVADPAGANQGLKKRNEFTKESQMVDLIGRLHLDICNQDRLLLNGVDVRIKLIRSKNEFCLMSSEAGAKYKVIILETILRVLHVTPTPSALLRHSQILRKTPAKYPIIRTECKTFTISPGNTTFTHQNLFLGQIPRRVCLALVKNEALSGSYKTNPFNFENFDVSFISLNVNGESMPGNPLKLKYDTAGGQTYIRAFYNLFDSIDSAQLGDGNQLDRFDFANGFAIYAFSLAADRSLGEHFNFQENGTVAVSFEFGTALTTTVSVIVLGEFDNIIEIDESRNILFDYNV